MKVVFISGAYRGNVSKNIEHAKRESIKLWRLGYAVFCPHLNTANFDGLCEDQVWIDGDLEILRRCDIVYMLSNWQNSKGSKIEHYVAVNLGKEIIYEDSLCQIER